MEWRDQSLQHQKMDGLHLTSLLTSSKNISILMLLSVQQSYFTNGHATHITAGIIKIARDSNVHLFVLPPHSSHMLQPLAVAVFSPFKQQLNSEIHNYLHSHPNTVIARQQLPSLISTAYQSSLTVTKYSV
jgi:hypothetical protein